MFKLFKNPKVAVVYAQEYVPEKITPIPPTEAEDTYIIFRCLELKYKVVCYGKAKVIKHRTKNQKKNIKERTVTGILQSLKYTKAPILTRIVYLLLPFMIPIFIIALGTIGYHISKGILKAYIKYYVYKDLSSALHYA